MVFDNSQFEKGVEETIKSLESLDKSLDSLDSGDFKKNIENMGQSAVGLDQLADQIEESKSKVASALQSFSGLFGGFVLDIGDIGKTIWSTINSAFNFQGGMTRALNIENAKFLKILTMRSRIQHMDSIPQQKRPLNLRLRR